MNDKICLRENQRLTIVRVNSEMCQFVLMIVR